MATTMDSADEAGGEAVFTSDGLPSLAGLLPPPPLPSVGKRGGVDDAGVEDDAVIEEDADPRAAFESFGDAGGASWMGSRNEASANPAGWVDPRRRLFQLKSEIDSLEASLADENRRGGGNDNDDDDGLRATTLELKARLESLGAADPSSLATMLRGRQEDLSAVIQKDLDRFGGREGLSMSSRMDGLSLEGEPKEGGDGKIVYELYRGGDPSPAAPPGSAPPREVALQERLLRLELAVGATTPSSADGGRSVLERVADAERLARESDAAAVERLAAKAKVVRADLEAAARARTKLAARKDATGGKDASAIAALHAQMGELEGLGAHLPALAGRLVELSALHATAAGFAGRLDAAEAAVRRAEGTMAGVEAALAGVEGGWKGNLDAAERNVRRLDELLAKQSS